MHPPYFSLGGVAFSPDFDAALIQYHDVAFENAQNVGEHIQKSPTIPGRGLLLENSGDSFNTAENTCEGRIFTDGLQIILDLKVHQRICRHIQGCLKH